MTGERKVSIVVPVYNCEPYLEKCIHSILEQTYENIELVLIDDGASDGSGEICDAYRDHDRVRIYHKENEGVSRARNDGILQASGQYIMFVDSDDTIEGTMVETLVRALQENGADCSLCGLVHD
ncbi:MAG: glycosyltransferase, partial [Roseburia sp.]|nr:glycosyltransferase [Roseburia sp.]